MKTRRTPWFAPAALWLALAGPAVALPPAAAHAAGPSAPALGEPWAVVPWGDGGPGLTARPEERPVGPTALAAGADRLWIADAAHEQLLAVGPDGAVVARLPLGAAPEDVVVAAGGPVALLADLQTVALAGGRVPVPAAARPARQLAVDAGGAAWAVGVEGVAAPLSGGSVQAAPLGAAQGVARLDGPQEARVLLWGPHEQAHLKSPTLREIPLTATLPIGLVRPVRAHADGSVTVLLELLASTSPVAVRAEVRRVDAAGRTLDAVAFDVSGVAPANRYVDVAPDGSLWVMQPTAQGLSLWRLAWAQEGAR